MAGRVSGRKRLGGSGEIQAGTGLRQCLEDEQGDGHLEMAKE